MNEQTRTPEAVNGLTSEQLREKLRKIKCFMLDMDGTFYLGNRILEGSLDFLDAVEATGRTVLFLTNNSSKSADYYVEKLKRMNVRVLRQIFCVAITLVALNMIWQGFSGAY